MSQVGRVVRRAKLPKSYQHELWITIYWEAIWNCPQARASPIWWNTSFYQESYAKRLADLSKHFRTKAKNPIHSILKIELPNIQRFSWKKREGLTKKGRTITPRMRVPKCGSWKEENEIRLFPLKREGKGTEKLVSNASNFFCHQWNWSTWYKITPIF